MTLSIGNKVRKMQDDGITPVPNEGHVLFEVIGVSSMQTREKDEGGAMIYVSTQIAMLRPIE